MSSIISELKKLSKDTFSYGLSAALQKLIIIFLFPIYARLLSPSDFGVQDIILSVINILVMFLILGMDSAVMQFYYENDDDNKKLLVSTFLWFELLVSSSLILLIIVFANPISFYLLKDVSLSNFLRLGVISVPFSLMAGAMLNTLRLRNQTKKFIILSTSGVGLQVLLAIIMVIFLKLGVAGVLLSIFISYFLQCIIGLFLTYDNYVRKISFEWLPKLLKVGIPLVPVALSLWVMNYSSRFFLLEYVNMEEVGLLSVISRVSSILLLFLSAFSSAWGPYAYNLATDLEKAKIMFGKILTIFTFFSLVAAMLLSMFARELIILLATKTYEKGSFLVIIYSVSSILWVTLYIVGIGAGIAKKNHHYTISVVSGAFVNLLFNFLLIPKIGILGAAIATFLGNLISTIYMFFAGLNYLKVKYEYKKLISIIVLLALTSISGILIDQYFSNWKSVILIYKLGLIIISFCLFLMLGIVAKTDFALLRNIRKN